MQAFFNHAKEFSNLIVIMVDIIRDFVFTIGNPRFNREIRRRVYLLISILDGLMYSAFTVFQFCNGFDDI